MHNFATEVLEDSKSRSPIGWQGREVEMVRGKEDADPWAATFPE